MCIDSCTMCSCSNEWFLFITRLSRGKPLNASNMQALEKVSKHFDGFEEIYDSADGSGIYETILDYPSYVSGEQSMPKPPAVSGDSSPVPEQSLQNASLAHTDFNQEPPSQYSTMHPIQAGTPGSQVASEDGPSQHQQLMNGLEISASYSVVQEAQKSDVNITHKEGETLKVSDYATLLTATKEGDSEYTSLAKIAS